MKATPLSAEDYFQNEVLRANRPQVADRFNTLVHQFMQLYKHEYSNEMETEEDDMVTNTI